MVLAKLAEKLKDRFERKIYPAAVEETKKVQSLVKAVEESPTDDVLRAFRKEVASFRRNSLVEASARVARMYGMETTIANDFANSVVGGISGFLRKYREEESLKGWLLTLFLALKDSLEQVDYYASPEKREELGRAVAEMESNVGFKPEDTLKEMLFTSPEFLKGYLSRLSEKGITVEDRETLFMLISRGDDELAKEAVSHLLKSSPGVEELRVIKDFLERNRCREAAAEIENYLKRALNSGMEL